MYGYEINQNEIADIEAREFSERWRWEQERIAKTIKPEDRVKMIQYFEKNAPDTFKGFFLPNCFVDEIAWRIYAEARMNPEEKFNPDTYQGEAFEKYVQDEMHYNRRDRDKILEALVKRAIDFAMRKSGFEPPSGDKENLRVSLLYYLPDYLMQKK